MTHGYGRSTYGGWHTRGGVCPGQHGQASRTWAEPGGAAGEADGVHLDPHTPEQAIVREALELKAAGLSLRKIGERLAARGLLPRQGRAWNPKTVRDLLQAEVV
jgi:hypothetical protein